MSASEFGDKLVQTVGLCTYEFSLFFDLGLYIYMYMFKYPMVCQARGCGCVVWCHQLRSLAVLPGPIPIHCHACTVDFPR